MAFTTLLAALAFFATLCLAAEHSVGPWELGKQQSYNEWATRETFLPKDTLKFEFAAGVHNVWQLGTQEDYDSCNVNSPIKVYNDADAVITLDSPGKYFYVCGISNHCLGGMKVTINVLDPSTVADSPALSPSNSVADSPAFPPALPPSHVTEHSIGRWVLGKQMDYKLWASRETFFPGDVLKFEFAAGVHNVWELATQQEYDSCNVNTPIKVYNDANATITLREPGPHFFVCGIGNGKHCLGGMKVKINVVDASETIEASPAPAPAMRVTRHSIGTWVLGKRTEYKTWAERETFFPGDTLEFLYATGAHNVWELATQAEYDACNVNTPIKVYNDENAVVTLSEPGKHFFVCGIGQGKHCLGGMKVTINVVDPTKSIYDIPSTVGGTLHNIGSWVLGKQALYKLWASQTNFLPGDSLKFEFAAGDHNVWQLATQEEYDSCNVSSPIKVFNDANAVIPLNSLGKHFYVCGIGNGKHCLGGMKVTINVVDQLKATVPGPAPEPESGAFSSSVSVFVIIAAFAFPLL